MLLYHPNIHRCEHIKVNGTQCGSPSLHHKKLCFFHERWQQQRLALADSAASIPAGISIAPALNLPPLEDANSIQLAIMQLLQSLLTGQLEHKTAALAFYALQTASGNLRHARLDPYPHNVVINPATVNRTRMGEEIWKNSDFNVNKVDEKETEDENDETNSLESNGETGLEEHSAETNSENDFEPLADNWRDELRTRIATVVRHAALQERLE
jgi:hypothetical protein